MTPAFGANCRRPRNLQRSDPIWMSQLCPPWPLARGALILESGTGSATVTCGDFDSGLGRGRVAVVVPETLNGNFPVAADILEAGTRCRRVAVPIRDAGRPCRRVAVPVPETGTGCRRVAAPIPDAGTPRRRVAGPVPETGTACGRAAVPIPDAGAHGERRVCELFGWASEA